MSFKVGNLPEPVSIGEIYLAQILKELRELRELRELPKTPPTPDADGLPDYFATEPEMVQEPVETPKRRKK